MNKNRLPPPLRWGRFRYGTAWTTTTTPLSSSGGLLFNIDSAVWWIVSAWNTFIEDAKYWMFFAVGAWWVKWASVDNAELHNGHKTLNIFSQIAAYTLVNLSANGSNLTAGTQGRAIPIKASTKYKITCPIKAVVNSWTPSINVELKTFNTWFTSSWNTGLVGPTVTTDWTNYSIVYTTSASAAYLTFAPIISSWAVHDSIAWFSIAEATVEEVIEPVANSLTSPSPSLVSFTAVGSADNIDVSQLTNNFSQGLWTVNEQSLWQPFIPAKTKFTWVVLQKAASVWTFVWDITVSIVNDNAWAPWTTVYATKLYTAAEWNALTDLTVILPCNLTIWVQHWIQLASSTWDNLNYALLRGWNGSTAQMRAWNGTVWAAALTRAYYFKSLYYKPTTNFEAFENNAVASVSTDESGFLEWSVINLQTGKFTWNSWIGSALYNTKPYYSDYSKTGGAWRWYLTTGNRIYSGWANEYWTWKFPAWLENIDFTFASTVSGGSTIDVLSSIDGVTYTTALSAQFVGTARLLDWARYVQIKSNGSTVKLESIAISADLSSVFTIVWSSNNIDQSFLTTPNTSSWVGWAAWSQYIKSQSFTATRSRLTWISAWKWVTTGTPTWNLKIDIRTDDGSWNATSTILASYTIPLATYTALSIWKYSVNLPCTLTPWTKYHIVWSNTATEAWTNYFNVWEYTGGWYTWWDTRQSTNGWTTWSVIWTSDTYFKTIYYTPAVFFPAYSNWTLYTVNSDSDWFLEGSNIDMSAGLYTYSDNYTNEIKTANSIYSINTPYIFVDTANSRFFINEAMSTPTRPDRQPIFKVDMGWIASSMTVQATIRQAKIQYSYDNINYFDWVIQDTATEIVSSFTITPNQRVVYLKFVKGTGTAGTFCYFKAFSIVANITNANIKALRNYPTNRDFIRQYSLQVGKPTAAATYRATKWGLPAIEYFPTEWTDIDNTNILVNLEMNGNALDSSWLWHNALALWWIHLTTDRFNNSNSAYAFTPLAWHGLNLWNLNIGTTDSSIAFWFKSNVANYGAGWYYHTIYKKENTQMNFYCRNAQLSSVMRVAWAAVQYNFSWIFDSKWHLITVVKNSATGFLHYYTDWVPLTTIAVVGSLDAYADDFYYGKTTTSIFNGSLWKLRLYTRALSDAEVVNLYNQWPVYQYLDIDTTATGSTVALSETWASYTTVADWASLAITSTSNPTVYVKSNITANRIYVSSNDYNSSSDKDWSHKQVVTYQVKQ